MAGPAILEKLESQYHDRTRAARKWKARGGLVVGYLCDNVPVELILAAGCLPYRLSGGPEVDLAPVRRQIDANYTPDLTARPDFVSAILARLLAGELDFLDLLIIPHNRHAVQAIYRELQELAPEAGRQIPPLHYLDKAWSPNAEAEDYNRATVLRLAERLGKLGGAQLKAEAIANAAAEVERGRALLTRLTRARLARPSRLTGAAALHVHAARTFLPSEAFAELATELFAQIEALPPRPGPRLFLGGSPFDHDRFYQLVEQSGATIVAEDHCWGARACDNFAVQHEADPLARIADRFHRMPACSIRFPLADSRQATVSRALAAEVDGAVFVTFERDAVQAWETPGEVAQLRAAGIKVLHLPNQSYASDEERLGKEVQGFVSSLQAEAPQ